MGLSGTETRDVASTKTPWNLDGGHMDVQNPFNVAEYLKMFVMKCGKTFPHRPLPRQRIQGEQEL